MLGCVYRVRLEDETSLANTKVKDILNELGALFDNVVDSVKEQCNLDHPNDDKMRVMISSTALKTPISTKLLPSRQITFPRILIEIGKVLQSNDEIPLDRSFTIDVVSIRTPRGSGKVTQKTSLKVLDYSKDSKLKRSVITIKNSTDHLCLPRAIVVSIAIIEGHPKLKQIKSGRRIQKDLAINLCRSANVPVNVPCGLNKIARFQSFLNEYQIVVIDFHARNGVIFEGPYRSKKIVLYKNNMHYDCINPFKIPAFLPNDFIVVNVRLFTVSTLIIRAMTSVRPVLATGV